MLHRPGRPEDVSEEYLGWLNDPEVLRFRAPKAFPTTMESLRAYVAGIPGRGDLTLAISTNGRAPGLAGLLRRAQGFEIVAAVAPEVARREAALMQVDAVLLDVTKPHQSSVQVCRELCALSPRPAVIGTAFPAAPEEIISTPGGRVTAATTSPAVARHALNDSGVLAPAATPALSWTRRCRRR